YILAGDFYLEEKNYDVARQAYEASIALDSNHKEAHLKLALCYLNLNRINDAEELFKALFDKDPHDIAAVIGLGSCFEKRGLFYKALHFYQSPSIWDKQDPRVYLRSGICALHVKRFTYAELYFQQALNKMPKNAEILSYLGLALEGQS